MDTFEQPETLVIEKVFRLDTFQEKERQKQNYHQKDGRRENRSLLFPGKDNLWQEKM